MVTLWVKFEPFFGWQCHIIPVVTPLLYPARTFLLLLLSDFFTSCCCICHTPFFFTYLPFHSSLSALSQHTSPCAQSSTSLFSCFILCSIPPSIHLSIYPSMYPPPPLLLSLSLVSLRCGLWLPSLSELLSLLSAPLARTKSFSAHGTTKDTREIKGKSLSQKKKKKEAERRKN